MNQLGEAISRVAMLAGVDPAGAVRVGGLTNINYRIDLGDERVVLRIPGEGTSEYIDRITEHVAARAAADAGVNAEVLFFDTADGLMVTRFVDNTVAMSPERFSDLGAAARAGDVFRRLHTTSAPFATNFTLFSMIDDYRSLLAAKGADLPDGYRELLSLADATRSALETTTRELVPSHCDPLCENFLDDGERMWLIDYEYAGNNDPMWDLGDLSVEAGFGPDQDAAMLRAYFGGEPPASDVGRMVAYKAMCDVLWTLWGVIQHTNGNPAEDFWAYAVGRFERCRTLMTSPEYASALEAIRGG